MLVIKHRGLVGPVQQVYGDKERERERKTDRQTQGHNERERQAHNVRERRTHGHNKREGDGDTEREEGRGRHKERDRGRQGHSERDFKKKMYPKRSLSDVPSTPQLTLFFLTEHSSMKVSYYFHSYHFLIQPN